MKQSLKTVCILFTFLMCTPTFSFSQVVVIVNPSNSVDNLSKPDLINMFRMKMSNWPSGAKVDLINLKGGHAIREKFSMKILKKKSTFMKRYYMKQVLTGKGQVPLEIETEELIKKYVSEHPNAISYISQGLVDNSVKIITIDGKKEID